MSRELLWAVLKVLALLVVGAVVFVLLLSIVITHRWPWQIRDQQEHLSDVVKLAFAVLAGLGGAVALVVTYRRQRDLEVNRFTEQFGAAAGQLGGTTAAVRLAGVYSMAALADEWPARRQQCIDVLCAYLRLPYSGNPADMMVATVTSEHSWATGGGSGQGREQRVYQMQPNDREVRHTVIRVIRDHLRSEAAVSWQGHDFDLTGAVFDGGDFSRAVFSGGRVLFDRAVFSGRVSFDFTEFSGGTVSFYDAAFSGGTVSFIYGRFYGGSVRFDRATFAGGMVSFDSAGFSDGSVRFDRATFAGGNVRFNNADFSGGSVSFEYGAFSGGTVSLRDAEFSGATLSFDYADFSDGTLSVEYSAFSGGTMSFMDNGFSGGTVSFNGTVFSGGSVSFDRFRYSDGRVSFDHAKFSGGSVRTGGGVNSVGHDFRGLPAP